MKKGKNNAYLTVCITLCLAVIMSLFLVLLNGARQNGARLEVECVTDIGLQSILAEYHRELMKQYNLFAIDASYGTALCSKTNTEAHLRKYLKKNLDYGDVFLSGYLYGDFLALGLEETELTKISILSDYDGGIFRRCAIDAIKADVGLELLGELQDWMETMEVNGLEEGDNEAEKQRLDAEIAEYDGMEIEIEEDECETLEVKNPTDTLEAQKRLGILKLVIEDEGTVSSNAIHTDNLIMNRMEKGQINQGNIKTEVQTGVVERFLFQEYLLRYMGHYGTEYEEDALRYQIEYLIAGKENDVDNLKSIVNRLCMIREAANALYLWSNEVKRAEIAAIAGAVCTLITLPQLTALLEAAILLAWAYAESIYDVKSLLAGGRIPLVKDDKSWHYSLSSALGGNLKETSRDGEGVSYADYLRIFMMMTNVDTLTARAMNMVEADIRNTPGNSGFRLDGCYESLEARIRIGSAHGHQYEITRMAGYY